MKLVTFSAIAARHGRGPAFKLLRTVERLADIRDEIISLDLDTRFEKALKALSGPNTDSPA
jgi:hypothetical protein